MCSTTETSPSLLVLLPLLPPLLLLLLFHTHTQCPGGGSLYIHIRSMLPVCVCVRVLLRGHLRAARERLVVNSGSVLVPLPLAVPACEHLLVFVCACPAETTNR